LESNRLFDLMSECKVGWLMRESDLNGNPAVFHAAEERVAPGDSVTLALLRAASTRWLRHGYAHTLVVDHAVSLPVAQQFLGHASVQTTAAYAKSDLARARAFVEGSFPGS
jgi:integrase/recombinase XerC